MHFVRVRERVSCTDLDEDLEYMDRLDFARQFAVGKVELQAALHFLDAPYSDTSNLCSRVDST